MSNQLEKLKKLNLPEASSTTLLKQLVVSVNGVEVPSEISKLLLITCQHKMLVFFELVLQTVTPNVDMTQEVECSSCGTVTEMAVPFTSEFFWPN